MMMMLTSPLGGEKTFGQDSTKAKGQGKCNAPRGGGGRGLQNSKNETLGGSRRTNVDYLECTKPERCRQDYSGLKGGYTRVSVNQQLALTHTHTHTVSLMRADLLAHFFGHQQKEVNHRKFFLLS